MKNKFSLIGVWVMAVIVFTMLVSYTTFHLLKWSREKDMTQEERFISKLNIKKLEDYLYYAEYKDEFDFDYALNYLSSVYSSSFGGCSTVRNGNFFGRNYDWYYSQNAEFVVRTPKTKNRHASIGIANSSLLNDEVLTSDKIDKFKIIPFITSDGINDAGVAVSINVVPAGDKGLTTGTNPGKDNLFAMMIPRFILDNAGSTDEAVSLLKNHNIYAANSEAMIEEFHFMIADKNKTVVVEFIDNKINVIENENILTNFYLTDFDFKNLPLHAMGIERYNILKANYNKSNSKNGMISLMKDVKYSKAYDLYTNPFWYSEFSGVVNGKDLTTKNIGESYLAGDISKAGEYQYVLGKAQEFYKNNLRNSSVWITVHTSVYDIKNKSLTVIAQENNKEFDFDL